MSVVSHVRGDRGRVGRSDAGINGVDPATIDRVVHVDVTGAGLGSLHADEAVVKDRFAKANGIQLGDTFTFRSPDGRPTRSSSPSRWDIGSPSRQMLRAAVHRTAARAVCASDALCSSALDSALIRVAMMAERTLRYATPRTNGKITADHRKRTRSLPSPHRARLSAAMN